MQVKYRKREIHKNRSWEQMTQMGVVGVEWIIYIYIRILQIFDKRAATIAKIKYKTRKNSNCNGNQQFMSTKLLLSIGFLKMKRNKLYKHVHVLKAQLYPVSGIWLLSQDFHPFSFRYCTCLQTEFKTRCAAILHSLH